MGKSETPIDWLHNEFKIKKFPFGIKRFSRVVFYPQAERQGVGVNAEKAKEIVKNLGGAQNFRVRKIVNRHLILRIRDQKIGLNRLKEISGKDFKNWEKKSSIMGF